MNMIYTGNITTRGYRHIQEDTVCQDASASICDEARAVLAVADGHGANRHFRSDRGAKMAVDAFIKCVENLEDRTYSMKDLSRELPSKILRLWHQDIENDLLFDPFTEEELKDFSPFVREDFEIGFTKYEAYGTTLLGFFESDKNCFALQIGDGNITVINEDGSIVEPVKRDPSCFGNFTSSLCNTNAESFFRFYEFKKKPAAVFLTSDGIRNSFKTSNNFHEIFKEIILETIDNSPKCMLTELESLLNDLSMYTCMDDMSISLWMDFMKLEDIYQMYQKERTITEKEYELRLKRNELKQVYKKYIKDTNQTSQIPLHQFKGKRVKEFLKDEEERKRKLYDETLTRISKTIEEFEQTMKTMDLAMDEMKGLQEECEALEAALSGL